MPTCEEYSEGQPCTKHECNDLHLCMCLFLGYCEKGAKCKLFHRLKNEHNNNIIGKFPGLTEDDILLYLQVIQRQKEESKSEPEGTNIELEGTSIELDGTSVEPEGTSVELERASIEPERASIELERASVELERATLESKSSKAKEVSRRTRSRSRRRQQKLKKVSCNRERDVSNDNKNRKGVTDARNDVTDTGDDVNDECNEDVDDVNAAVRISEENSSVSNEQMVPRETWKDQLSSNVGGNKETYVEIKVLQEHNELQGFVHL